MNEIDDDPEFDESQLKHTTINMDIVTQNVPKYSSQKLCEMIVCDRYFGMGQNISIICMEELAKRRAAGDSFDFEEYIEKSYKDLPPLNFDMPDLRAILTQALKNKGSQ